MVPSTGKRSVSLLALASITLACGSASWGGAALAQPVVQPLPVPSGSQTLNAALVRLARDPRDLNALIDAGRAALQMGDVDAALGFFARADQISPDNMQVKAGLAAAMVRSENPFDAIPLFAEAEKAGAMDPGLLSDRGLAYDLVGDTASAERYYRQSLGARQDDETLRRMALSQAIAGDRAGMELTLSPLLQKQDKAAWRTRAFALAILGRPEEAVAIANQTMPADLAAGIAPYLRYMPRLTSAQQAAAANFGRFPRAAEIGHDDPRVALYAPPRRVAGADAALVPAGEPLGSSRTSRTARNTRQPAQPALAAATPTAPTQRSAPPEPMPTRQVTPAPSLAVAGAPPPVPGFTPSSAPTQMPASAPAAARPRTATPELAPVAPTVPAPVAQAPVAPARTTAPVAAPVVQPVRPAPAPAPTAPALASAPGFDLARVGTMAPAAPARTAAPAPASPPAAAPVPSPAPALAQATPRPAAVPPAARPAPATPAAPAAPAARPRRVADAFADLAVATGPAVPAPGAVDVRKIAAAKPKPPEAPKPPPKPVHPSRIWVQVGTGRNVSALGFTWRGLVKDNPELFKGKSASVSDWGRTNRLLTGPFATGSAAEAFLAKLKKKDVDAFLWTSPAGQVVDDL